MCVSRITLSAVYDLLFCLFQICDVDNDGILSDQELNDFQVVMCVPWWIYRYIIYMYMYMYIHENVRGRKFKGEKVYTQQHWTWNLHAHVHVHVHVDVVVM